MAGGNNEVFVLTQWPLGTCYAGFQCILNCVERGTVYLKSAVNVMLCYVNPLDG